MTALPFQFGSHTSEAAAKAAEPNAATKREALFDLLRAASDYGMTDDELEQKLGWPGNTVRPRRVELVQAHRVRDSGRTRKTRSGRQATVWIEA